MSGLVRLATDRVDDLLEHDVRESKCFAGRGAGTLDKFSDRRDQSGGDIRERLAVHMLREVAHQTAYVLGVGDLDQIDGGALSRFAQVGGELFPFVGHDVHSRGFV